MIAPLLQFIALLRRYHLPVSTAESLDAMRAVTVVGWDHTDLLYQALSACLVKQSEDRTAFDHCFDAFFHRGGEAPRIAGTEALLPQLEQAGIAVTPMQRRLLSDEPGERELALLRASERAGVSRLRMFTQRGLYLRRLLDELGIDTLEAVAEFSDGEGLTDLGQALRTRMKAWRQASADFIEGQLALVDRSERRALTERRLLETPLSQLGDRDRRQLAVLVARLARALARRPRVRPAPRRGRLDLPRTLRANARFDAVPLLPRWRRRQPRQAVLYVLCDVSGSVAAYAGLLLHFLAQIQTALPRVRSFVFCSDLVEVSDDLERSASIEGVQRVLRRYGGGSSDYGSAFSGFCREYLSALNRHASVLVLGDARTNLANPGEGLLASMASRAGRVIWFNPEPQNLWDTGDSVIAQYTHYCRGVYPCNTLSQLSRAVALLLRDCG